MIRHFFKLIWNRRRANGLILTELTLCFLVLCGTLTTACYFAINWNKPLGFKWQNMWRMDITMPYSGRVTAEQAAEAWEQFDQLRLALKSMDGVVAASPTNYNFPYTNTYVGYPTVIDGVRLSVQRCFVMHDGLEALGLTLIAGRWFEPGDENLVVEPAVLTRDYATLAFGDEDPVGKILHIRYPEDDLETTADGSEPVKEVKRRVIGVVADYRMRSALRPAYRSEFSLFKLNDGLPPNIYAIRTEPGTTAGFQEELFESISRIAPGWTVEINPVSRLRARELRGNFIPLTIFLIVAGFLILMVGLGLVGVLWQSVTRRTEEMGIRRAVGASEELVRGQILGELLALTTVAVLIGSAMFLQMPILQVIHWMPWQAYALALAISLVIIYPFVMACGLYPAWLATRIHPANALQHE
jgi:putative ABC transport system permease protein